MHGLCEQERSFSKAITTKLEFSLYVNDDHWINSQWSLRNNKYFFGLGHFLEKYNDILDVVEIRHFQTLQEAAQVG